MPSVLVQDLWVDADQGAPLRETLDPTSAHANDRAPVVLFHDSLGCVALWRDFPERLARSTGRQVVAYDRLGFGRSDPHPAPLDSGFVRDEARAGFRFLRKILGLGDFIAFGHSVGGGMAAACAAAYASHCLALITESAQAFVEDRTVQGIRHAEQAFAQPGELDRLKKDHGEKAAWVLSAWIDTWLAPDFVAWNLDDDLRRVQCPVLILHGDDDEYGSVRHPERIAALTVGRSVMRILPGAGHVPHREKSEAAIDIVARWLADIAG